MSAGALTMLVSARVDPLLRSEVAAHRRPRPEFLRLEEERGVDIVDWTAVTLRLSRRSRTLALGHVAAAAPALLRSAAVLSDGEHLGVPVSFALAAMRSRAGHVMIVHDAASPARARMLELSRARGRADLALVFSQDQAEHLVSRAGWPEHGVRTIPYGVDTDFWTASAEEEEEQLVVAAGRERRDFITLTESVRGEKFTVHLTDSSTHSQGATRAVPERWPDNVVRGPLGFEALRGLYGRAAVVAVPLLPTRSPAGITAVLEAMAMAKAVVVTDTPAMRGVVEEGVTGVLVPNGRPDALRTVLRSLLGDPDRRRALGQAARRSVLARYDLGAYVGALSVALLDAAGTRVRA